MVRLKENLVEDVIEMCDLKDGQIAVVIDNRYNYKGQIVQRYKDVVITLGAPSGKGWSTPNGSNLKVKVLKPGTILILE